MAEPTSKISRSKRGMRRSHNALSRPGVSNCSNCGAIKRPHHVCGECGFYKGREIVTPN